MNIRERIDQDIKTAMLAGEKPKVETLKGLKTAIQYAEVAKGNREDLAEPEIINVLGKEAKKRQESADLYRQGGNEQKATSELAEKAIIETYLPAQLSDEELMELIEETINLLGISGPQAMGQLIGAVKARTGGAADGAKIAALAKERLSK